MSNRNYWLDLFTGVTWKEFLAAGGDVSGFRESRWAAVQKIKPGDYLFATLPAFLALLGYLKQPPPHSRTQARSGRMKISLAVLK